MSQRKYEKVLPDEEKMLVERNDILYGLVYRQCSGGDPAGLCQPADLCGGYALQEAAEEKISPLKGRMPRNQDSLAFIMKKLFSKQLSVSRWLFVLLCLLCT